jgi:hypothetical protein
LTRNTIHKQLTTLHGTLKLVPSLFYPDGEHVVRITPRAPADVMKKWSKMEWFVYHLYCYQFGAVSWEKAEYQYVLTAHELGTLKDWSFRYLVGSGQRPSLEEREDVPRLISFIAAQLQKYTRCFVKFSSSSGKTDRPVRPLTTVEDTILYLIESKFILLEYEHYERYLTPEWKSSIVMKPFDDRIRPDNEYRIFVSRGVLRGVSIQKWYDETLINKIDLPVLVSWLSSLDHPFVSYVMDMFLDDDGHPHFIEYNAWSARGKFANGITCNWCGSGCSRFHSQIDSEELGLCVRDYDSTVTLK